MAEWSNSIVWALPREVSDHYPLVVRYSNGDWGPKPFRFNNLWLQNKRFKELVVQTWQGQMFSGISDVEVVIRKRLFDELWGLLKSIDASIFQRSRAKWLKEGDANSKYFHSWPVRVREAAVSFFQKHFDRLEWIRPTLEGVDFTILSELSNITPVANFSMEEIEEAVNTSDGSKCPGPDGFNFAFIKEF
ncbi:LINE-1 reverse transcriptase like [Trifolium medium]|uniref:LINE-1 reverse transcriptase like n=1 Tax=Trifolium medium TaxID=97028 RepID=A0A392NE43_9FABA|nr:LINE-1 reverse transcriptase like [Trifolium medium]